MALNAWLTFYRHYSAADLRKLEKYYLGFVIIFPLLSSSVFIFIDDHVKGKVYGPAIVSDSLGPNMYSLLIALNSYGAGLILNGIISESQLFMGQAGKYSTGRIVTYS
jgi:hypothetical protein